MRVLCRILNSKSINFFSQFRCKQTMTQTKETDHGKMFAWQVHCYSDSNIPELSRIKTPIISSPTDVIVKVEASSVNPIDIAMKNGYGSTIINILRHTLTNQTSDIEFPLTFGRDFTGTVVSKGHGVEKLELGDRVWGIVPIENQGCHAEYVVTKSSLVNLLPETLNYIQGAGILYTALTAWSSLWIVGGLGYKSLCKSTVNQRVLVLGGSGGVGTMAIQLLKSWNIPVVTTCSEDAVSLLNEIGANVVINYNEIEADLNIIAEGPYQMTLDCCTVPIDREKLNCYPTSEYISLNSPFLSNYDQHGLVKGTFENLCHCLKMNIPTSLNTPIYKWAICIPSTTGLNAIQELAEKGQILPVIQEVFPFEELPNAYAKLKEGHARGKIIINMR